MSRTDHAPESQDHKSGTEGNQENEDPPKQLVISLPSFPLPEQLGSWGLSFSLLSVGVNYHSLNESVFRIHHAPICRIIPVYVKNTRFMFRL